ncbi:MAG: N-glycosylase/DNA lyase [Desulfurococcales archaeon]|nr:N-glycosylase/DNA lyase [Desulfurococcales archaeon]
MREAGEITCYEERARELGMLVSLVNGAIYRIEEDDPQFSAVRSIVEELGPARAFVVVLLIALVSYRLPVRGEEWWSCLARLAEEEPPESLEPEDIEGFIEHFLKICGKSSMLTQRMRRIHRALKGAGGLIYMVAADIKSFPESLGKLQLSLARALGQRSDAKTIVFSIKMGYYVARAAGIDPHSLRGATTPMPVDSRVACLTYSSRLCDAPSYEKLISKPQQAQRAWEIVASESKISPINLDALAWRLGWIPRDIRSLEEARAKARELLSRYVGQDLAARLATELITRLCKRSKRAGSSPGTRG